MGRVEHIQLSGRHGELLEQLYREHEAALLQYLTRMLGNPELAREVAQDTYEKLHTSYRPEEVMFPRAVLFKIATNTALMRLRRARLEASIISGPAGMDEVPDEEAAPERRALAEEVNEHLVQAIKELRPSLREVFVLAYVQGQPRKQIAQDLGITLKRLDKRLTQALKDCRERLTAYGIDPLRLD
jgi:RNA polymerase sigma-70 factor (ECF subfamily)